MIDVHTHLALRSIYPKEFLLGMAADGKPLADEQRIEQVLTLILNDVNARNQVRQMDDAGIDLAVLLMIDGGIGMGEAEFTIEEIYRIHNEIAAAYAGKLIVFGGVDPRRGTLAADLFASAVRDHAYMGLKLYPPMGFDVADPQLDSSYRLCSDRGLTVMVHSGPSLATMRNEKASPAAIAAVAQRYPDASFILAHAGYQLSSPEIAAAIRLPNVYVDISGFQKILPRYLAEKNDELSLIFRDDYCEKVLFGSDWPLFNLMSKLRQDVTTLRDYADAVGANAGAVDLVLHGNASRILRRDA
jgi:predicted TIM-barrel fold metal-dependent hydrolase